jgi:hypothetical protein
MSHRANALLVGLAGVSLALAGCQPVGTLPVSVQSVVSDAQALCGFLPTVESVAALVGAAVAGIDTAETIATTICNEVAVAPKLGAAFGGARHVSVTFHDRQFIVAGRFAR